ncbi:MAG: NAD-binding protein [Ruminococcus sp.]|nr:NAD-binding protein [Ruminococcus sp.]
MEKQTRILIAGGDMRQIYCAERLSKKYETSLTGFDSEHFSGISALNCVSGKYDCIVLPVPPLDDGGNLTAPCFSGNIRAEELSDMLETDGIVFTGRADSRLRDIFPQAEICDYMSREELMLRNAVPTAEGAVQTALEELPVTLNGMKVLIVGMGRIGTALAEILKGFGADITAVVHNAKGAATAGLHGVKAVYADDMDADFGLVFNTVPSLVLDRRQLMRFDDDTLFIDLASKPGGIDFSSAAELGKKAVWALGLPGKTAPVTSGRIIADTISGILGERGDACV